MTPFTIRPATVEDVPKIAEMREAAYRKHIGHVTIPVNTVWWVAELPDGVHGCCGLCFVSAQGFENSVIVTDIYDDGTFQGKRAIVAMLKEASATTLALHTTVPLDRIELAEWLFKQSGFQATGITMERPAQARPLGVSHDGE